MKALCPTCRHCVPKSFHVAGKVGTELTCARVIASFPTAITCRDYERAPGADDQ